MKPLKNTTLADDVENALLQHIRRAGLQPGDALPKEEELSAMLGVSRHVVREGLSRLKSIGLIESRQRRGMVLTSPNVFAGVSTMANARLFSDVELRELMGIRVIMELGMADFIYRKRTPEAIGQLRELSADAQDYAGQLSREIAFHSALFAIGGNAMASQFRDIVSAVFKPDAHANIVQCPTALVSHVLLCDVLEFGTSEEFRQKMAEHLQQYTQW